MDLTALAESDPSVMAKLQDLNISNRALGRELGCNEKSVRRWRSMRLQSPNSVSTPQPKYKQGVAQWVPGMDLGQEDGEIRTVPRVVGDGVDEPEDAELMRELGVDPETWEIIARRESRWQSRTGGDFLKAYRISVRRRSRQTGDLSVEAMNTILAHNYSDRSRLFDTGRLDWDNKVFVIPVGDLQVGKIDGGGTPELIERFAELTDKVRHRLEISGGTKRLVLPWLGDCIEGIVSQGGRLATRLDVSVTEQVRIYRRLMMHQIATLAPLAEHVVVAVVPGNHDETTRQFSTTPLDSWAIEGASAVQDALAMADRRFGHVRFVYPETENLAVALEIGTPDNPWSIGFAHGHQASNPNSALGWWNKQTFGRQAVGQANILMTGHFHHLRAEATGGGRTWIQIPALDGGSNWFKNAHGADEPAGMVSLWVTPNVGNGWEALTVHR